MGKEEALELQIKKAVQGTNHDLLIQAVLSRQHREAVRIEIDQCVTDDDAAAIARIMNGELTTSGPIKSDYTQAMNGCRIVYRLRIRHFFAQFSRGKNRCGVPFVKRDRGTEVIRIGQND
ncbi:MAG: hypothetical protein DMF03_01340 [Verrucomicrobia bacterium]|nr:MAG: hypothetical protein DMF03_01340 [Verrucomicrobiota bacterium]